MEIIRESVSGIELIRISGRLDGYWSAHLGQSLAAIVREGGRHLRLDFSEVAYLSSAAIGELMKTYKDLQAVEGSLVVMSPTKFVQQVLDITKLTPILMGDPGGPMASLTDPGTRIDFDFARFEVHELAENATLECVAYGDETLLETRGYGGTDARRLPLPPLRFALGLGALGETFEDCHSRFGEYLGVPGAVVYQPTDGTGTADYLQAAGRIVPEINTLYGLFCDGDFSRFARFEASPAAGRAKLSELAQACLDVADADSAGFIMLAETTGLLGVALRKSPCGTPAEFGHPGIRNWITFQPERVCAGDLTLIAGVVSAKPGPSLRPILRADGLYGHFHAAAFSYRPLRKGKLDLKTTIATLFESSKLHGVLHLIADPREIAGVGESEFVRGACWVSPLSFVSEGGRA